MSNIELEEAVYTHLNIHGGYMPVPMPKYARNIEDAWLVCEEMRERGGKELKEFKDLMEDNWLKKDVARSICECALRVVTDN